MATARAGRSSRPSPPAQFVALPPLARAYSCCCGSGSSGSLFRAGIGTGIGAGSKPTPTHKPAARRPPAAAGNCMLAMPSVALSIALEAWAARVPTPGAELNTREGYI